MESVDKCLEIFMEVRQTVEGLQAHKDRLEAALEHIGFANVVHVIRNDIEKKYPRKEASFLRDGSDDYNDRDNPLNEYKHPLLLEDIVQTLSRYLDFETLQATRMVHPSWDTSIVTQRFLQKTKLVIRMITWDFWELKNLIDAFPVENSENVKVPTTLAITSFGFDSEPEPFKTWLKVYGPKFTRIEIGEDEDDFDGEEDINHSVMKSQTLIRWLVELLPNLKELQIDNFDLRGRLFFQDGPTLSNLRLLEIGSGNRGVLSDPFSVRQFVLCTSKNLETLRLWLRPKQQVQYLRICHETNILRNLTALDLSEYKLSVPTLELLATINFKHMKKLVFRLETRIFDPEPVEFGILLDNVKNTLEELIGGLARDLFRFPEMKQLKKLHSFVCDSAHSRSIELLTLSPKLDSLTLSGPGKDTSQVDDHALIFGKLFPAELRFRNNSLKKLDISNFPFDQGAFSRLVLSLPALEVLSIGCTNRQIFGNINWSLGKFFKDLENLKKLVDLNLSFQTTFGWGLEGTQEFSEGIAQGFPKQQSLKKCSMFFGQSFAITEQAFTKGFMQAPSLQRLQLRKFVIGPQIRPLVDALRNKNVEVEMPQWYSSSEDTWPVIYCKYK